MLDRARTYEIAIGPSCLTHAVIVSRQGLLDRMPGAEDWVGRKIDPRLETLGLISAYVEAALRVRPNSDVVMRQMGEHLLDLVALALSDRPFMSPEPQVGGLAEARFAALCATIARRLRDPRLSISLVAREHRISERYVQKLFERRGRSFTTYVRDERLSEAYRQIADPARPNRRIADIALGCGFGDVSYFKRSFRSRYGCSPTDVRGDLSAQV